MSELLIKAASANASGIVTTVTPESAGWKHVGFRVHRMTPGMQVDCMEPGRECCLVVLEGVVDVTVNGQLFPALGKRKSVFERTPPYCVYAPPGAAISITALDSAEIALCTAPGRTDRPARVIEPSQISTETRGVGTNTRHVNGLLAGEDDADSLIIFEVYTPGGHWSSYPPHKHDEDKLPAESSLEETYYHRLSPKQGFAFQRVYTDDRQLDETMTVHDGDTVLVPRGYHPVGAPHGYDLYYLNVMAGPKRRWVFRNDPDHEWMLAAN